MSTANPGNSPDVNMVLVYPPNPSTGRTAASITTIACIISIIFTVYITAARKRRIAQIRLTMWRENIEPRGDHLLTTLNGPQSIPYNYISEPKGFLGAGNFGIVIKAELKTKEGPIMVAVKRLINPQQQLDLLDEAIRMHNFKHRNVLGVVGISMNEENVPLIITSYMSGGPLSNKLKTQEIPLPTSLRYCEEMAHGLQYLHQQRFVHCDLAARNCMLDETDTLKIADFGLSQCLNDNYYITSDIGNKPVPVAWYPIEYFGDQPEISRYGDIWAYGVTMWEIFSKGLKPYKYLLSTEIIEFIRRGRRLDKPDDCPQLLYDSVMLLCWAEDKHDRPSLEMIIERVRAFRKSDKSASSTPLDNEKQKVSHVKLEEAIEIDQV
ncbi:hypothetical protein WR25_26189 [Diploscapter pachys]|uniref:Protein kinase domain-containing protein n=1 Tax=Diploscapter pachys TaxID=2018661 RepID=A0A2A2KW17_9BILA|nr:hypothetical protein WR25_26189 [Diploscapter pachys]